MLIVEIFQRDFSALTDVRQIQNFGAQFESFSKCFTYYFFLCATCVSSLPFSARLASLLSRAREKRRRLRREKIVREALGKRFKLRAKILYLTHISQR